MSGSTNSMRSGMFLEKVTLPYDYTPTWPDKCVVCHNFPDSSTTTGQTNVPICQSCKSRFEYQGWVRGLVAFGFSLLFVFHGFGLWVFFLFWLGLGAVWPRAFDLTTRTRGLVYNFASSKYAEEFRNLNASQLIT